jgi:hypothetical protein
VNASELLRVAFADFHKGLLEDVADLDEAALFWQPSAGVNHVGFLFWHIVRDEDTVVTQSVLRESELWSREGWFERLGMDEREQGTGFDRAGLTGFRYSFPAFVEYAHAVWRQTDEALRALDPDRLDEELSWSQEWKLANFLTTGCLSHGWVHLGEIRQLRGLRGWAFRE